MLEDNYYSDSHSGGVQVSFPNLWTPRLPSVKVYFMRSWTAISLFELFEFVIIEGESTG